MIDNKKDWWPTIATVSLVLLLFIVVFSFKYSAKFKESIKRTVEQRDSLKTVISRQSDDIVNLSKKIQEKEFTLDTLNYRNGILKRIIKKYEKNFVDINTLSTDDNVRILSDRLSKEN